MSGSKTKKDSNKNPLDFYSNFEKLNGKHDWIDKVPSGGITYKVRVLPKGKIAYFNFKLAKEMDLIPKDHPEYLNKNLENKILETFNIRIINEYDIENNLKFKNKSKKENEYMATRYLQLQHNNKQGKTSGDGRCIWNGQIKSKAGVWDVNSRGTGVTSLAPGAVKANKNLQTGSEEFGYGCGLAEIDELYSCSILSEIFHNKGLVTERMLAVIDSGSDVGIGVRAGKNLIRPAHLFLFLKQGEFNSLKNAVDYIIDRQFKNKEWNFDSTHKNKYNLMLEEIVFSFSKFAAILEREYIFTWLDWDGDNVLTNAGIIDYGSIRQFGIRHDSYKYDDVERFSTTLNQQKNKAKEITKVFIQVVDFLKNKTKKPLNEFKEHKLLKKFDSSFDYYIRYYFLQQIGFESSDIKHLLLKCRTLVNNLYADFEFLEKLKTHKKEYKVDDGKNRHPILNMRNLLKEYPTLIYNQSSGYKSELVPAEVFHEIIKSEFAIGKDAELTAIIKNHINDFQKNYFLLISHFLKENAPRVIVDKLFNKIIKNSAVINRTDRLTGNALVFIVNELLKKKKAGLSQEHIQKEMIKIIENQSTDPKKDESIKKIRAVGKSKKLTNTILTIIDGYKEDI